MFCELQVDNHLPGAIFPVVVSKRQEETPPHGDGRRADGSNPNSSPAPRQETPFLQLSIIKEVNQSTNTAHYDYVAFRCGWNGLGSDVDKVDRWLKNVADSSGAFRLLSVFQQVGNWKRQPACCLPRLL